MDINLRNEAQQYARQALSESNREWYARVVAALDERDAEIARLRAALTPSAETKAAYIGEFTMDLRQLDEFGVEQTARITIPWTSVKEIMRAIEKYADEQKLKET